MNPRLIKSSAMRWAVWCCATALFLSTTGAFAQSFFIDQQIIAGGGGVSGGGEFSVAGTIGQADSGNTLSGGDYALQGGFGSVFVALQTPGAPALTIVKVANTVQFRWSAYGADGFMLEKSTTLGRTAVWSGVTAQPTIEGGQKRMTHLIIPGSHFFRLRKP